mmetsp:Transcript_49384/g.112139  ORF Transcript_49384/g.112139 Transcript_49384/m.112139 type:complete len:174 (+) Transcript_49384:3-524(+)
MSFLKGVLGRARPSAMSEALLVATGLGNITLRLRPDAAPQTVDHVKKLVADQLYDNCCFYRSDFVIQGGLQRMDGSGVANRHPDLTVNETNLHAKVSNERGTVAFGHWDVPDNGNSEFFINLQHNPHLDSAYGGYCVFAQTTDPDSMAVVDAIAAAIKGGAKTPITSVRLATV